ncbi:uncharacterized protein LOC107271143 isoform X2 [Cephus cinctus]|uniref:Uncharacterized protein LOC107271143 isoform X2 n=1 Tax=Cephus cinctus TaxID=211228 RepID=A0AAJ7C5I0_CEPCN|nr:uncharacterized protein LOC107271143 isoform X2 [Cephus cinctus]
MQQEGTPRFLKFHQGSVRGVAFSPRDRYLFCSGGYDGKVNLYSALRMEWLLDYQIELMPQMNNVNAVRFTSDGSRIVAATNARSGRDRTGLATDPSGPNLAISVAVNGKGLTLVDLRMPLPLDYVNDLHGSIIRDICFVPSSWPWQNSILTGSSDGTCKVSSPDGRVLHAFQTGHAVNTVCITPEPFTRNAADGFCSLIMSGGDLVSSYVPDSGVQEFLKEHKDSPIWKLRYTSNGSTLYSVCDGGILRRYRRYPDHHEYLGEVYRHRGDIQDLDVSPYDEYIITASKDRSVGVLLLGSPNHGFTEYIDLT